MLHWEPPANTKLLCQDVVYTFEVHKPVIGRTESFNFSPTREAPQRKNTTDCVIDAPGGTNSGPFLLSLRRPQLIRSKQKDEDRPFRFPSLDEICLFGLRFSQPGLFSELSLVAR